MSPSVVADHTCTHHIDRAVGAYHRRGHDLAAGRVAHPLLVAGWGEGSQLSLDIAEIDGTVRGDHGAGPRRLVAQARHLTRRKAGGSGDDIRKACVAGISMRMAP